METNQIFLPGIQFSVNSLLIEILSEKIGFRTFLAFASEKKALTETIWPLVKSASDNGEFLWFTKKVFMVDLTQDVTISGGAYV
jgi:hypothetical protein